MWGRARLCGLGSHVAGKATEGRRHMHQCPMTAVSPSWREIENRIALGEGHHRAARFRRLEGLGVTFGAQCTAYTFGA